MKNKRRLLILVFMVNAICYAQSFDGLYATNENYGRDFCAIVNDTLIFVHSSNEGLMRYFGYIGPFDSSQWQKNSTMSISSGTCLYRYNATLDANPCSGDSILFSYELPYEECFSHRMFLTKGSDTLYLEKRDLSPSICFPPPSIFYVNVKQEDIIDNWLDSPIVIHTNSIMSCSKIQAIISKGMKYTVRFKYADEFISNELYIKELRSIEDGAAIIIQFDAEENDLKTILWRQKSEPTRSSVEEYIKLITYYHKKEK